MKDNIIFFKEFIAEFQNTGSFFPTSRWAAEALTEPVRTITKPKKIVELGPGTGSVTTKILENMGLQDTLTICEINERFMTALKKKLAYNPHFLLHKDRIEFFLGPMQELPEKTQYDIIVCALPFLNFEPALVKEMFDKLKRLGHDGTILTYYEYIGIRSIGKSVAGKPTKSRLKELDLFFKEMSKGSKPQKKRVWLNLLPINIYTLRLAA